MQHYGSTLPLTKQFPLVKTSAVIPDKMQLKTTQRLELPATADMHVHLRQGEMMELVVPTLTKGGVDTAFV